MQRCWPAYCLLAATVTFGCALYDPYQLDGDAVSYMDLGAFIRSHHWAAVINGYWNPLYPAALALAHTLLHATPFTELRAYYFANFVIFLLQMAGMVSFTDALLRLRERRAETIRSPLPNAYLIGRYCLRYLGIALLVISAERELSMGKIRPDALLQALLLFAAAALLNHLVTSRLRHAALLGLALGLAYLTKSVALPLTILCLCLLAAFRLLWLKHKPTSIAPALLLILSCFLAVAGPYIAALSLQKGRLDFGDSGSLNLAWFVSGTAKMHLQPGQPQRFGVSEVHLKHPEEDLLQAPIIFSYKLLPYGTYPDWFDPSFWNDRIKPHIKPRLQMIAAANSSERLVRYLSNHPEAWILLALFVLLGARFDLAWRTSSNAFWLVPVLLSLSVVLLYGLICIEDRYISFAMITLLLTLFAAFQSDPARISQAAASSLILLLSVLALGQAARNVSELRRNLAVLHFPGGWYDPGIFQAAHALNELGIGPGDTVACIGDVACLHDQYWARLAGVRILTEIYEPTKQLYPALAAMPGRDRVYDLVRQQGARALVGSFDPGQMTGATPASAGWRRLADTHYYLLPLNLKDRE